MAVSSLRRAGRAGALGALPILLVSIRRAGADHAMSIGSGNLSPIMIGILAGVLALTASLAIVVIAILLAKKPPRAP